MKVSTAAELAARQLDLDRRRTSRFEGLFERKVSRMLASPLAFLRGSAPLFYELLTEAPELAKGPSGEGWIAGDLHLENFGAYRADEHSFAEGTPDKLTVVFDLNDFDEATIAPWRFDVLRLTTSVLLAGRTIAASGPQTILLARGLVDAYVAAAMEGAAPPAMPRPVRALVDQVRARTRKTLLDARTTVSRGVRTFQRGERYRDLSPELVKASHAAFAEYVASMPSADRPKSEQAEILDVALRIAGTGSLGCLRVAVLVRGKGGADGGWIFDMKEEDAPAPEAFATKKDAHAPAERVVAGMRACLEHPPRQTGVTTLGSSSLLVRRLAPQEDKLAFARIAREDLAPTIAYLGACVGHAHARGATMPPKQAWTAADRDHVVDAAIELAALHEGAYLALCRRAP